MIYSSPLVADLPPLVASLVRFPLQSSGSAATRPSPALDMQAGLRAGVSSKPTTHRRENLEASAAIRSFRKAVNAVRAAHAFRSLAGASTPTTKPSGSVGGADKVSYDSRDDRPRTQASSVVTATHRRVTTVRGIGTRKKSKAKAPQGGAWGLRVRCGGRCVQMSALSPSVYCTQRRESERGLRKDSGGSVPMRTEHTAWRERVGKVGGRLTLPRAGKLTSCCGQRPARASPTAQETCDSKTHQHIAYRRHPSAPGDDVCSKPGGTLQRQLARHRARLGKALQLRKTKGRPRSAPPRRRSTMSVCSAQLHSELSSRPPSARSSVEPACPRSSIAETPAGAATERLNMWLRGIPLCIDQVAER